MDLLNAPTNIPQPAAPTQAQLAIPLIDDPFYSSPEFLQELDQIETLASQNLQKKRSRDFNPPMFNLEISPGKPTPKKSPQPPQLQIAQQTKQITAPHDKEKTRKPSTNQSNFQNKFPLNANHDTFGTATRLGKSSH